MSTPSTPPSRPAETRLKTTVCPGHTRPICHIAYSNIIDGTFWFVGSCHDMKPMLRNGETGNWVGTFEGHRGAIYGSVFNNEATRVVTGSGDFSAKLWDAITGNNLHTWMTPHYIKTVDWKNNLVVTGCYDAAIRLFDAEKPVADPAVTLLDTDHKMVKSVFLVDNCQGLITSAGDVVKRWDLRNNQVTVTRTFPNQRVVDFTGRHHVVSAHEKELSFLDPATLDVVKTVDTGDDVECGTISSCGKFFAIGSKLKVREFDNVTNSELECHRGHHGPVFHVRYAPDGKRIASGAEDGIIRLWPTVTAQRAADARTLSSQ